ncbi:MAG: signal peptidase II [Rhodospirillaceae bacterium]|nr:MAG: signal peptidase II [Rhodospirillaceae bacterium]
MSSAPLSLKRLGWALAAIVFVADQISKFLILDLFSSGPQAVQVWSFFNLVMAWNPGVSFGMFGAIGAWGPWILVAITAIISVVLAVWLGRAENRLTAVSLGLILGGAVGNIIDRVRFGAVVDFLDVHVMGYHWPAFNVADSAITVGAVFLILESLFYSSEKPKTDT